MHSLLVPRGKGMAVCLFVVGALIDNASALDLTPFPRHFSSDGFTYTELVLKSATGDMSFSLPPKWSYRGGASELRLTPPDKPFAEAVIEAAPLPQPFTESPSQQAAVQRAIAGLPPGCQSVELVATLNNSLLLTNSGSYEVIVSYKTLGETFERSVIFVNTSDTAFMFRFTARKADFESLNRVFRRTLGTWRWGNGAAVVVK